ncbi:MAG: energy transducer TonB [Alistipes shahii]
MGDPLRHGRPDAAAVERRRTARRVPGQAMTFRGLIGACVLLTAPAAAFGQKPTAAKQPVAADSAAAQPAEKQPAARIVVFRDSLVLIHCDTPPLFREGDIRTFREWVNEQVRNVRIVIGCPPFPPRVVVSFVIGTTGRLTGIRVLQSPDSKLSAEAVRALESSPHWKPGELYGRKVPVEITIPVDFRSSN